MTGRKPRPGDRVLIRGAVSRVRPEEPDMVIVNVACLDEAGRPIAARLWIRPDQVAEVLGPQWLPAQDGDVALDRAGRAWQYDAATGLWVCASAESRDTEDLLASVGPVVHVARGGKPVAS